MLQLPSQPPRGGVTRQYHSLYPRCSSANANRSTILSTTTTTTITPPTNTSSFTAFQKRNIKKSHKQPSINHSAYITSSTIENTANNEHNYNTQNNNNNSNSDLLRQPINFRMQVFPTDYSTIADPPNKAASNSASFHVKLKQIEAKLKQSLLLQQKQQAVTSNPNELKLKTQSEIPEQSVNPNSITITKTTSISNMQSSNNTHQMYLPIPTALSNSNIAAARQLSTMIEADESEIENECDVKEVDRDEHKEQNNNLNSSSPSPCSSNSSLEKVDASFTCNTNHHTNFSLASRKRTKQERDSLIPKRVQIDSNSSCLLTKSAYLESLNPQSSQIDSNQLHSSSESQQFNQKDQQYAIAAASQATQTRPLTTFGIKLPEKHQAIIPSEAKNNSRSLDNTHSQKGIFKLKLEKSLAGSRVVIVKQQPPPSQQQQLSSSSSTTQSQDHINNPQLYRKVPLHSHKHRLLNYSKTDIETSSLSLEIITQPQQQLNTMGSSSYQTTTTTDPNKTNYYQNTTTPRATLDTGLKRISETAPTIDSKQHRFNSTHKEPFSPQRTKRHRSISSAKAAAQMSSAGGNNSIHNSKKQVIRTKSRSESMKKPTENSNPNESNPGSASAVPPHPRSQLSFDRAYEKCNLSPWEEESTTWKGHNGLKHENYFVDGFVGGGLPSPHFEKATQKSNEIPNNFINLIPAISNFDDHLPRRNHPTQSQRSEVLLQLLEKQQQQQQNNNQPTPPIENTQHHSSAFNTIYVEQNQIPINQKLHPTPDSRQEYANGSLKLPTNQQYSTYGKILNLSKQMSSTMANPTNQEEAPTTNRKVIMTSNAKNVLGVSQRILNQFSRTAEAKQAQTLDSSSRPNTNQSNRGNHNIATENQQQQQQNPNSHRTLTCQQQQTKSSHRISQGLSRNHYIPFLNAIIQVFRNLPFLRSHLQRPTRSSESCPANVLRTLFTQLDEKHSSDPLNSQFYQSLLQPEERNGSIQKQIQITVETLIKRLITSTIPSKPFPQQLHNLKVKHLNPSEEQAVATFYEQQQQGSELNWQLFEDFYGLLRYCYCCEDCTLVNRRLDDFQVFEVLTFPIFKIRGNMIQTGIFEADICNNCQQSRIFQQHIEFIKAPRILCIVVPVAQNEFIPVEFSATVKQTKNLARFELIAEIERIQNNLEFVAVTRDAKVLEASNKLEINAYFDTRVFAMDSFQLVNPQILFYQQKYSTHSRP